MPLLLTTAQYNAIAAGARVRQVWTIQAPSASGSSTFSARVIDDTALAGTRVVVDPGQRRYRAANISPMDTQKIDGARYAFEVDNSSGVFHPFTTASWWNYNGAGAYQAAPQECRIAHQCYVDIAGTWSELTMIAYIGAVVGVSFVEYARAADGAVRGNVATIETEALGAWQVLRQLWTRTHGYTTDTGQNPVIT